MVMLLSIQIFSFDGINGQLNVIVLLVGFLVTMTLGFMYFLWTRSRQMLNAIPGIWTSLGILGTFYVIVQSLGGGVEDISNDAENLNGMVDGLVTQIIPAFTTSIIGIIGAIVTSLVIKIIYAQEDEEQQKYFNHILLDELQSLEIPFLDMSPEFLLVKIYKQMSENVQQIQILYDRIYETNKKQAKILLEEYMQGVRVMLDESQTIFNEQTQILLADHKEAVKQYFDQEFQVFKAISEDWEHVIQSIPQKIDNAQNNLAHTIEQVLVNQNNKILSRNEEFTNELLSQVANTESELAQRTTSDIESGMQNLQNQLEQIVETINRSLDNSTDALENTAKTLSDNMNMVSSSLVDSSKEYAAMVVSLKKLMTSIDTQLKSSEKIDKSTMEMNKKIGDLLKNIDEIVLKNQQLRFELMQWKRVHKRVIINEQNGTKECPNCHTGNPMDAYFCRHCNFGFWETQALRSTKQ